MPSLHAAGLAAWLALAAGAAVVLGALWRSLRAARVCQAERLRRLERLAALGELAAGIVHEMRNPLSTVQGFLQLHGHRLDPDVYQLIMAELGRVDGLAGELLHLARPSQPDPVPLDAGALVEMAQRLGQMLAAEYEGRLEVRSPADLPRLIGNLQRLRQVLLNLLKNAFEAAPGGVVRVEAGVSRGQVWLAIADTGPGVPPEVRERIFAPFFTTKPTGTGLGLTVSRRIMAELGGSLEWQPSEVGARFVIRLPLAP